VPWEFHDVRDNPAGALEAHRLILAIGLCLVDDRLLGPASCPPRGAADSSSGHATLVPGLAPAREIRPAPDLYYRAPFA
jgi:hypothetical protein